MTFITTHVLDLSNGRPAAGIAVALEHRSEDDDWKRVAEGVAGPDGRLNDWLKKPPQLGPGRYRLLFDAENYWRARGIESFFPHIAVEFELRDMSMSYHVPLLLGPYGYSAYRGS